MSFMCEQLHSFVKLLLDYFTVHLHVPHAQQKHAKGPRSHAHRTFRGPQGASRALVSTCPRPSSPRVLLTSDSTGSALAEEQSGLGDRATTAVPSRRCAQSAIYTGWSSLLRLQKPKQTQQSTEAAHLSGTPTV